MRQPSPHRLSLLRRWLLHPAEQCVLDASLLRERVPGPTSSSGRRQTLAWACGLSLGYLMRSQVICAHTQVWDACPNGHTVCP